MKLILVGLDSSPRAQHVLATALDLARRTGSKVRLLRAVGLPPELPSNVWSMPPAQVTEQFLVTARQELDEAAKRISPELLDGCTVQVGVPWDAICNAAKEHDVDLIVIGSHGYGILDRLLGTTAAKVVNHSDRSVLVVKSEDAAESKASASSTR